MPCVIIHHRSRIAGAGLDRALFRLRCLAARRAARRYRAVGSIAALDQRLAEGTGAAVPALRPRSRGATARLSHTPCNNPFMAIASIVAGAEPCAHAGRRHVALPSAVLGHLPAPRCPLLDRRRAQRRCAESAQRVLLDGHDGAAGAGNVRLHVRRAAQDEPGVDSGRHGDLLRAAYRLHHHTVRAMAGAVRPSAPIPHLLCLVAGTCRAAHHVLADRALQDATDRHHAAC